MMEIDAEKRVVVGDISGVLPSARSVLLHAPSVAAAIAAEGEEEEVEEVLLYLHFPHFEHTASVLFGPPNNSNSFANNVSNDSSSSAAGEAAGGGMAIKDLHLEEPVCIVDLGPGREVLEFKGSHQISLGMRT
jgi:hypothetical protein